MSQKKMNQLQRDSGPHIRSNLIPLGIDAAEKDFCVISFKIKFRKYNLIVFNSKIKEFYTITFKIRFFHF